LKARAEPRQRNQGLRLIMPGSCVGHPRPSHLAPLAGRGRIACNAIRVRGTHHELSSRREPLTPRKAGRGEVQAPDWVSRHPGNGFEIAGLFRLLVVLAPIYAPWMGAVRSHSRLTSGFWLG
jgi:hypothetical protein